VLGNGFEYLLLFRIILNNLFTLGKENIQVLIADNHLLIREGMRSILSALPGINLLAEAADANELLAKLKEQQPDIVIIDCFMPGFFKPEDIPEILSISPQARVMVVTTQQDKSGILKVLGYGVSNFILKQCDKDEFISAVYATYKKENFFCGKVVDAILEKHFPQDTHCDPAILSQREIEIINDIALGLTNGEIAKKNHLSVHTVSTHRRNILKKLKLKNASELVMYGIRTGIIKVANV